MKTSGKRHLILIGLMGSGKSTVGRLLSRKLGLPFADLDEEIERRQGCTVREIFRQSGEEAFREIETETLRELLLSSPMVLATGGGTVLRKENRERMSANGWVVHLAAGLDELIRRLAGASGTRPLLDGDPAERIRAISGQRAGLYDFADWTVRTDGLAPEETAAKIARMWRSHV